MVPPKITGIVPIGRVHIIHKLIKEAITKKYIISDHPTKVVFLACILYKSYIIGVPSIPFINTTVWFILVISWLLIPFINNKIVPVLFFNILKTSNILIYLYVNFWGSICG